MVATHPCDRGGVSDEAAEGPLSGDVPKTNLAIGATSEHRVDALLIFGEAGDGVVVREGSHEGLREDALEFRGIQRAGILLRFLLLMEVGV